MLAIQNVKAAEKVSQRALLEFLQKKAKEGSDMSTSDVLAVVWTKTADTTTVEDSLYTGIPDAQHIGESVYCLPRATLDHQKSSKY